MKRVTPRGLPSVRGPRTANRRGRRTLGVSLSLGLAVLLVSSCASGPERPETPDGPPRDPRAIQPDLDRQKAATRRRLDGVPDPESATPPESPRPGAGESPGAPTSVAGPGPVAERPPADAPAPVEEPARPIAVERPPAAPVEEVETPNVGPPPVWCSTRRHPRYPESEFLLGVGQAIARPEAGSTPAAAADETYRQAWAAAVADILAQFETRVTSEVTTLIQQSLRSKADEEEGFLFQAGSSRVRAQVEGSLQGVQPAERYFNPRTGSACVLVALRRLDYARGVGEEIGRLDEEIEKRIEEAESFEKDGRAFRAYRLFGEIEALLVGRQGLEARARFASPDFAAGAPPVALADAHAARRKLAPGIELWLVVEHERFGEPAAPQAIEEKIVSQLAGYGFRVKLATGKVASTPVGTLVRNLGLARESLGAGESLLLVCKLTSEGQTIEAGLHSVRTAGWARVLDVLQEELLVTVATPVGRDQKPAVGIAGKKDELAQQSASHAAEYLARQIYLRL